MTTSSQPQSKVYSIALFLTIFSLASACTKEYITEQNIIYSSSDTTSNLSKFWFSIDENPFYLNETLTLAIDGSEITGRIPYYTSLSSLKASFETNGKQVLVGGKEQVSGESTQDFRKPVEYVVVGEDGKKRSYTVNLLNFTGLPVIRINTEGHAPISTKETYVSARIRVDGAGKFDDMDSRVRIRGRGNSTWGLPKKPYRLRFEGTQELLGMPAERDWVLLANYNDKTHIRNEIAYALGRKSTGLDWTSRSVFAEVFLNKMYVGTYQVCEQIKVSEARVNVTSEGFLLEIDQLSRLDPDDVYFRTARVLVNIKAPDVVEGDEKYTYISTYVNDAEKALFGTDFTDPEKGYKKYLDVDSFVDWYLVNEIAKNNDATFFSSCFMNLSPGGKLKMGPLWDFDLAFGNINYNDSQHPEGLRVATRLWYARLFQDPEFVAKVKERFSDIYKNRDQLYEVINENTNHLKWSVIEDNSKWETLYKQTGVQHAIWGAYHNEVIYLKNWLETRFRWLDNELSKL